MISDPANALGALAGKALLKYVETKAVVGGHHGDPGHGQDRPPLRGLARPQRRVRDLHDEARRRSTCRRCRCATTDYKAQAEHLKDRHAFVYHLSEGTDPTLIEEYTKMRDEHCLRPGLGGDPLHRARARQLRRVGAAGRLGGLVAVLEPVALPRHDRRARRGAAGVRICLGADWSPSGSKNLLGELKVADMWNKAQPRRRAQRPGALRDGHLQPRRRDRLGRPARAPEGGPARRRPCHDRPRRRPLPQPDQSHWSATCSSWPSTASRSTAPRS